MHIFFLGYPGAMGGANTECFHTAKIWRQAGTDVSFVPTWGCDPAKEAKLAAMGCKTVHVAGPQDLADVPGFAASVVVAMCNGHVLQAWKMLKELRCRLVWVNCMTFLFDNEAPPTAATARPTPTFSKANFSAPSSSPSSYRWATITVWAT